MKATGKVGLAAALALACGCLGCFSTWDIAPKSLRALDGYHEPDVAQIRDRNGDEVKFDRITELHFVDGDEGHSARAKFSQIQVHGSLFAGIMRPDGRPFTIDLSHVTAVEAKRYSAWKTGLAIGVPVGVAVVLSTVLVALSLSATTDDGSDSEALHARRAPGRRR
jgi:hypothetical protein